MLPMAVARSSSGGAVIGYVLPVLSLTTCLHYGQDIGDAKRTILKNVQHGFDIVAYTQTDPPGGSTGPERSLIATIAYLLH